MKRLIVFLIAFSTVTQIAYSQSVDSLNFKEINTFLAERNECVDLLIDANYKIGNYNLALSSYDSLIVLKDLKFMACDSLVNRCSDENFMLSNRLQKSKDNVKVLSLVSLSMLVIIVLMFL